MQIERALVADLTPDPKNVRLHAEGSIAAIESSLKRFGQQKPIVVDGTGRVVSGNGTLQAARKLGWEHIDIVRTALEGVDAVAFAIADNRTAELSDWDWAALQEALTDLEEREIDAESLGFDAAAMRLVAKRMRSAEVPAVQDPEPVPLPDEPTARLGDLWTLGRHRIVCGDALLGKTCDLLFDGHQKAAMAITDPPYNVDYNSQDVPPPESTRGVWGKKAHPSILNDRMSAEEWARFTAACAVMLVQRVDGCVYVFHAPGPDGRIMASALDAVMHWSGSLVWVKNQMVFGRAAYQRRHECLWFGWPEGVQKTFTDDRTVTDVWEFNKSHCSDLHPTMKPTDLVAQAIHHASDSGHVVFDPFLGSGTTIIAAEQLGRSCYGIELDPRYVDVAVQRWVALTGETPECIPEGPGGIRAASFSPPVAIAIPPTTPTPPAAPPAPPALAPTTPPA